MSRCPEGDAPHEPHIWINSSSYGDGLPDIYFEGSTYLMGPSGRRQWTESCPGRMPDPAPDQLVSIYETMKLLPNRKAWLPEWFKVRDQGSLDQLVKAFRAADRAPDAPREPLHALTGIPIVFDEAIPSNMLVFVDQAGKMVVLDFRKQDEEKQDGSG